MEEQLPSERRLKETMTTFMENPPAVPEKRAALKR